MKLHNQWAHICKFPFQRVTKVDLIIECFEKFDIRHNNFADCGRAKIDSGS